MTSEKIESLWCEIRNRRLTNTAGKEFVPEKWLSDFLTEGKILDALGALDDSIIDKDECPQVAGDVWKFGLKIFAISLIMKKPDLVYRFLQSDQFDKDTGSHLDKRLPMKQAQLENALGLTRIKKDIHNLLHAKQEGVVLDSDPKFRRLKEKEAECIHLCQEFLSVQDMFLSPTFPQGPLHRFLLDSTRLPFILIPEQSETADSGIAGVPQGAFGKVSKEVLPPERYGDKSHTEASSAACDSWLLLATSLLELYGSYTYHMRRNFLFREAVQGDLHDLLERERRLPEFQHDEIFYLAFCSLASALEQVHCYSNDDLNLNMIGCHHDLKPRNVLVDDGRFILADFGLATMKDNHEDPRVLAQDRDLYFAAPENIDYVEGIRRQVGPPSDIRSLGCILAEVHTFMRGGRDAVRDFRHSRAFDQDFGDMTMTIKAFHDGLGQSNPATIRHLDHMEAAIIAERKARVVGGGEQRPIPELGLVQLVRDMLTINDRPDIKRVLQRLRCVTLQKKSEPIYEELLVSPHLENIEFIIERQVFREWLGRLEEAGQRGQLYLHTDAAFDQACKTLGAMLEELRLLAQDDFEFPLFSQLRRLNEQLLSCLDVAGRLSIRRAVERNAMPIARQIACKSGLPDTFVSETALLASGPNANILRLLAAAQVKARMGQNNGQTVPRLERADVKFPDPPKVEAVFRLGTLKQDGGAFEIPVVVEEMAIGPKHAKPKYTDRLFKRLENVLSLGITDTLPDFCALNCSGIYFDMDNELIGLTYKYPPNVSGSNSSTRVVSLAQLLDKLPETVDYKRNLVIGLDDRVQLARDLALAISNFHHIGWMHKNTSSHTVLFFHNAPPSEAPSSPRPPPRRLALSAPALIGFSHSRQKDETIMSSKRYHTSTDLRAYHHPEYADEGGGGDRETYRAEFDYYSLGLMLLELGQWWPLRYIVQDRHDRAAMRDYLLRRSVPFLAGAMGDAYARATEACLSGVLEGGLVEDKFSRLVISPLEELLGNRSSI